MNLAIPTTDTELFASLPADCLKDIARKHEAVQAMRRVKGIPGRAGEVARKWASVLGLSLSRTRQLASDFESMGWRALWDRSRWPAEVARAMLPREFIAAWRERVLKQVGGKTVSQCYEKLIADWRIERQLRPAKTAFPGYPHTPEPESGTGIPAGWSRSNLCGAGKKPSAADMKLATEGAGAYRGFGPQVLTDRRTLDVGERLQIDDYHWNQHVLFNREIIRVHQLGILDVRSACLASVFFKPVYTREDGAADGIKQDHTILLLASHLFNHGYIPGKTRLALEKGTAGLHPRLRESLLTFAPGLHFDDAGSRERHQVDGNGGKDRTNANMKAALESLHHLLTNIEAEGPASTGANYVTQPERVHGLMKETKWLLSKVQNDEQFALLRLGVLTFEQFLPWARGIVGRMNARRNHSLQGFPSVTHYRLAADSEDWLTPSELLALPQPSQLALADSIRQNPALFSAKVKQSPSDVWNEGRAGLTRLTGMQACHLAASVMGKGEMSRIVRTRTLDRAYFKLSDSRLAFLSEPIVFESRILDVRGEWRELPAGMDVEVVFNPLDEATPRKCFVRDERGGFMGVAMEATRINPNDREELLDALAIQAQRTAARTADVRAIFAREREATRENKAHNRRVLSGEPVTAEQKQRARADRAAKRAAQKTLVQFSDTHTTHTHDETDTDTTNKGNLGIWNASDSEA